MRSHELLRAVLQEKSAKQVASDMGLSLSMIYKWAESSEGEDASGAANPLDRIEALIKSTGDRRIAQWICERAGGFFIENPETQWPHPYTVIPATNRIVQEFADLLSVIAIAAGDNHISEQEAARIRRRWEDLKSVTEGFVHGAEEGNFGQLEEPA